MKIRVISPIGLLDAVSLADQSLRASKKNTWSREFLIMYSTCVRALLAYYRTGKLPADGFNEIHRLICDVIKASHTYSNNAATVMLPNILSLITYID